MAAFILWNYNAVNKVTKILSDQTILIKTLDSNSLIDQMPFLQYLHNLLFKLKRYSHFLRPRSLCFVLVFFIINFLLFCLIGLIIYNQNKLDQDTDSDAIDASNIPLVLYWNDHFSVAYKHFVSNKQTKINCPYKCIYSTNKKKHEKVAKVRIFHERTIDQRKLPPNNSNALNVYYTLEPPPLSFSINDISQIPLDYFNVTASYRSNSKIYYPYDYFIELNGEESKSDVWIDEEIEEKLSKKSKIAINAMSNCQSDSKRHLYITKLQKFMNVTRIGDCQGNTKCKKVKTKKLMWRESNCMEKLIDEHYFYLAFENAVCPEYVSEKFWRLRDLIVPVVLSRASMPLHIPNDTYIAASDFESPQALANHLLYLIKNKNEYKKYVAWTKKYRKSRIKEEEIAISCQLCELAYKSQNTKYYIEDYEKYWSNDECIGDYALDLINNRAKVKNDEKWMSKIVNETSKIRLVSSVY